MNKTIHFKLPKLEALINKYLPLGKKEGQELCPSQYIMYPSHQSTRIAEVLRKKYDKAWNGKAFEFHIFEIFVTLFWTCVL